MATRSLIDPQRAKEHTMSDHNDYLERAITTLSGLRVRRDAPLNASKGRVNAAGFLFSGNLVRLAATAWVGKMLPTSPAIHPKSPRPFSFT